ncbi:MULTISPECIES: transglycosylase SLT domain-containing protein [unclassified Streptomyces]|uniref:transglycosylase SLT domain-containing protein n=1 Tax=unclassified Streptomyces TaxID=2593676 RepID=UPI00224CECCD|nr:MULTISPECIES: transglycosylase SLT domain-containing protein [unclassified Streptomyces]MCX5139352.1 transglycosylase SLT domain-containing protein [Streptomyces sp. NBC_00338]WRZ64033.1 transglycosylase SLT domain-containing protein [Streptomyces sp. NBC_01257]WSU57996.1 transglycosylase SLT domain-containing protein [Streptomyces sp. NBC_01104]
MSASSIPGRLRRLNKTQKLSAAGISAVAAAALSLSLVPGHAAEAETEPQALSAAPVVFASAAGAPQAKTIQNSIIEQHSTAEQLVKAADAAKAKKAAAVKEKAEAVAKAKKAKARAHAKAKAHKAAAKRGHQAASRSESRTAVYGNNLDGWIKESLAIMKAKGIPGTYDGLHRNIIRESSGNPRAINDWDVNAVNGVPSKGLLQIIKPTFDAYHVGGTPHDQYDPVANITASANYAADKYGSIDNVNSAY